MSKTSKQDQPRKITVKMDDAPAEDTTLLDMLRDGERPKPGEPGILADRLGAEVRDFLGHQVRIADKARRAVNGQITITIKTSTGPEGDTHYATDITTKKARLPAGTSLCLVDEDGDMLSRPASRERDDRQIDFTKGDGASKAEPKVGAANSM